LNFAGVVHWAPAVAYLQKLPNVFSRELVWLHLWCQFDHLQSARWPQLAGNLSRSTPPGGIAVQHKDHTPESLQQQVLLRLRERGPHQCDHGTYAGLVQMEAGEEAFDHNHHPFAGSRGAVKIEQDLRFGKARRKAIARCGAIQRATAVGDQFALCIG
jgi:hypothetical protein